MSPIVTIKQQYNFPLVIDEQGVRTLYNEISKTLSEGQIYFNIVYSDKSSISNPTIENVVRDENRKERQIKELKVIGTDIIRKIDLAFGHTKLVKDIETYYSQILLEISGPDRQTVFIIKSLIEDRLKTFTATHIKPLYLMLIFLFFYTIVAILFFTFTNYFPDYLETTSEGKVKPTDIGILFGVIGLGVLGIFIIHKLFPSLTFLIGAQIDRHNKLVKRRFNLLYGVGVGIILTLIGALISKAIS